MIPMGLITCILNPSSVKQKSIRTSSKLPSSKPQRKAVVRHGVEWRLTTAWGKSWLKPNICRLTQTPTSDTEAQWSSQAGCWARGRLHTHFSGSTVPPWRDNHSCASASLLIFFIRRDPMQHSRHNLSSLLCDSLAISTNKHSVYCYMNMLQRQGHHPLISCSRWKKIRKNNTIKIIKEEMPLSEITCINMPLFNEWDFFLLRFH